MSNPVDKSVYGERIRDVREKMGLSQAEFAKLGGVTARAQRNYEAGLRTPNISYLESLAAEGYVDVSYILSGTETHALDKGQGMAFGWLADSLGLDIHFQASVTTSFLGFREGRIDRATLDRELDILLDQYRVSVIDTQLLAGIIESVEKLAPSIDPRKKAGVVVLLYRSFRVTGRVDEKAVIEAVDLTK